jgi:hypothetical protein
MEVGQGPNWGCSVKKKKSSTCNIICACKCITDLPKANPASILTSTLKSEAECSSGTLICYSPEDCNLNTHRRAGFVAHIEDEWATPLCNEVLRTNIN